jgi:hypothetical protein
MAEGYQDHGRIPVAVTVIAGRLHHPLHLALGQILTGPIMGVWEVLSAVPAYAHVGQQTPDVR